MRVRHIVFILLIPFLVTSCANYKDVPYFQNSQEFQSDASAVLYDMTIKPKDQLSIFVFSGTVQRERSQSIGHQPEANPKLWFWSHAPLLGRQ